MVSNTLCGENVFGVPGTLLNRLFYMHTAHGFHSR